ncbi:hypothetical protein [Microvirga sp. Mcv34]|uniref:hypothetical protein n=1 Tax=Microvirga sp. Mcv34 TaxID=2926016 RepID=UPI0021C95A92|nr:hypothetical protein [Microvirga sp. Mcv34]
MAGCKIPRAVLERALAAGETYRAIAAKHPGATSADVRMRCEGLGLAKRMPGRKPAKWNFTDAQLRAELATPKTLREIGAILGCHRTTVRYRASVLGIPTAPHLREAYRRNGEHLKKRDPEAELIAMLDRLGGPKSSNNQEAA